MPIRNIGTLLENIVLLEAGRALLADHQSVVFCNSFAMPPLSGWCSHTNDFGISIDDLYALQTSQCPKNPTSYEAILWHCLQQPPNQPASQGPNGALLCSVLAHRLNRNLKLWLNDIPKGHYGNAIPSLRQIDQIARDVMRDSAPNPHTVEVCEERFPASLTSPTQNNLLETLRQWAGQSTARLGFLDPDRFVLTEESGPFTSPSGLTQWLKVLSAGFDGPVISVHFTGHNNWDLLCRQIATMCRIGGEQGFNHALIARYSYYHVICQIRGTDHIASHFLCHRIREAIIAAWQSWRATIGCKRHELTKLHFICEP